MAATSDPNLRVVEILNFLASRPTEHFTLSEIATQLQLSNGTAHRVLSALTGARYLHRHPRHKTYSLGVALVAVGQAALEQHRGVDVARREMVRLAEGLKAQCMLTTIVDDEMLFVAKEGIPYSQDELFRIGERRPFLPPLGLLHIAWAAAEERSNYLQRAQVLLGEDQYAHIEASLPRVRELGYAIAANGETLGALARTAPLDISKPREQAGRERVVQLVTRLTRSEIFEPDLDRLVESGVAYISAPVFSPEGSVAFEIALSGLPENLAADEIERYVRRLCASAALVTSEIYGRKPSA